MSHYFIFVPASLIALALPGPDFLLVLQTSLRRGRRAGVWSAIGISLGLCVHGLFATLGLSAILLRSARAFEVVKWLGALYLVYLAVQLIVDLVRSRHEKEEPTLGQEVAQHVSARHHVLRGFLTNVLNVKAALFFVSIVPQFVSGDNHVSFQLAVLSSIQIMMAVLWFSSLALAINKLGVFLKKRVVQRWLDGITAAIFMGLAARLASATRN